MEDKNMIYRKIIKRTCEKILFILCCFLFVLPLVACSNNDKEKLEDYTYNNEGGVIVITGYKGIDSNIILPNEIEGYPVEIIDNEAFKNCKSIKEITLPECIKEIRFKAFSDCIFLETINIENDNIEISDTAFQSCKENLNFICNEGSSSEEYAKLKGFIINGKSLEEYDPSRVFKTADVDSPLAGKKFVLKGTYNKNTNKLLEKFICMGGCDSYNIGEDYIIFNNDGTVEFNIYGTNFSASSYSNKEIYEINKRRYEINATNDCVKFILEREVTVSFKYDEENKRLLGTANAIPDPIPEDYDQSDYYDVFQLVN